MKGVVAKIQIWKSANRQIEKENRAPWLLTNMKFDPVQTGEGDKFKRNYFCSKEKSCEKRYLIAMQFLLIALIVQNEKRWQKEEEND